MTQPLRHVSQVGFTLMEMVISLVVLGLLSVVMLPLLSLPITSYMDAQRRVELQTQLELIRSKITDDLQYALPGSMRVRTAAGGVSYLEYLEVHATGRYRSGTGSALVPACPATPTPVCSVSDGNSLVIGCAAETCFSTLGALNPTPGTSVTLNSDYVAIMGPTANPYLASPNASLSRLTARAAGVNGERLTFTANSFPSAGASNRVYVVSPVSYECNPTTGHLTRYWGYSKSAIQPTAFPGASSADLANTISTTSTNRCRITVTPVPGPGVTVLRQVMSMEVRLARTTGGQPTESVEGFIQVGVREP